MTTINPLKQPVVGDAVVVTDPNHTSNGTCNHPAIVTRVHQEGMINTMAFPDCGVPYVCSSIARKGTPSAEERYWQYPGELEY